MKDNLKDQHLVIVAGGTGSRMQSTLPKQFIDLGGMPVIVRTIRRFLEYNPLMNVVISVHPDFQKHLQTILDDLDLKNASITITEGGATRFDSVKNGLKVLQNAKGVVGIHDAARPFVSQQTIRNCFETAAAQGNAVPCIDLNESIRQVKSNKNAAVNRSEFKVIQTPQCFLINEILDAFRQDYDPAFTDDATVLESKGKNVILVEGNAENIKITSPHDLLIAKALLENEQR